MVVASQVIARSCVSLWNYRILGDTSETIQRHFKKVHRHLQGRSPSVDNTINISHELATQSSRPSLPLKPGTLPTPPLNRPWRAAAGICFSSYQRACTRRGLPHSWILVREAEPCPCWLLSDKNKINNKNCVLTFARSRNYSASAVHIVATANNLKVRTA